VAALQRSGLLADAAQIYVGILKVEPKNFDALHLLAVARYQQNRFGLANSKRARLNRLCSAGRIVNVVGTECRSLSEQRQRFGGLPRRTVSRSDAKGNHSWRA
jgi:hypothetical protein